MFVSLRHCLPLALALASSSILALSAKAVPLQPLSSTPSTSSASGEGPRRPGSIAAPAADNTANPVNLSQQRGRAVPGLRDTPPRKTLAEGAGSRDAMRVQ